MTVEPVDMTVSGRDQLRAAVLDTIAQYAEYAGDTGSLRVLTERGFVGLFGALQLAKNAATAATTATPEQIERVERMEVWTKEAQRAIDSDFALFHAHSLMGLWGALEAMVDDVAARWTRLTDGITTESRFAKVKVPVVTLLSLAEADRYPFLVAELKRDLGAGLKVGVGQFEALLDAVGLGGDVPSDLRRVLIIGQQLRNLIAHRRGIADRRFLDACPDLGYGVGDHVTVSTQQFYQLIEVTTAYAVIIADRVRRATGLPPTKADIPHLATGFAPLGHAGPEAE